MAWSQSDLDRIDAAIAQNIRRVTFADGRSVEYQSPGEMLQVRRLIKAELLASASQVSPRVRATRAVMRRP